DPFTPYSAANSTPNGYAPLGERLFGIGYNPAQNRVYFGRWSSDNKPGPANSVWSVALDANGDFLGTEQLEVTLPLSTSGRTMPVASISFDPANPGKMLLAERGMDSTVA